MGRSTRQISKGKEKKSKQHSQSFSQKGMSNSQVSGTIANDLGQRAGGGSMAAWAGWALWDHFDVPCKMNLRRYAVPP